MFQSLIRTSLIVALALVAGGFPCSPAQAAPLLGLERVSYEMPPRTVLLDRTLWADKTALVEGIEASLGYLRTEGAKKSYERFNSPEITLEHVEKSLERLRELLLESSSPDDLDQAIRNEFAVFRAKGFDGRGTVRFTGYFQPSYEAKRTRTDEYRYPIYYLPPHFPLWNKPHPTRVELEGPQGLGGPQTLLYGSELAWLKNRFDVFMIHLQGSAVLEFEGEEPVAIGFAAGTEHPFKGISASILKKYGVPWNKLDVFFGSHPEIFDEIISRNNRFIFFTENPHGTPLSSLGLPVTPGRSIATDKLRFPPGAVGLIKANLPEFSPSGRIHHEKSFRFVLDHDSGSAIKGAGRVDLYMGSGPQAQRLANNLYGLGQLYYLLLKDAPKMQTSQSDAIKHRG
ncbi:MAG: MltA domain-containing protein [Deltaproteobacteria bacterium]|nr:MltA domain-containing protein [Deltaproteobacteria bacterium]